MMLFPETTLPAPAAVPPNVSVDDPDEDAPALFSRLGELGLRVLGEALDELAAGRIRRVRTPGRPTRSGGSIRVGSRPRSAAGSSSPFSEAAFVSQSTRTAVRLFVAAGAAPSPSAGAAAASVAHRSPGTRQQGGQGARGAGRRSARRLRNRGAETTRIFARFADSRGASPRGAWRGLRRASARMSPGRRWSPETATAKTVGPSGSGPTALAVGRPGADRRPTALG